MAALNNIALPLAGTVGFSVDPELFRTINDLYLQMGNLVNLINATGPVMQSPNGHYWTAAISNAGVVTWTDVGTVRP